MGLLRGEGELVELLLEQLGGRVGVIGRGRGIIDVRWRGVVGVIVVIDHHQRIRINIHLLPLTLLLLPSPSHLLLQLHRPPNLLLHPPLQPPDLALQPLILPLQPLHPPLQPTLLQLRYLQPHPLPILITHLHLLLFKSLFITLCQSCDLVNIQLTHLFDNRRGLLGALGELGLECGSEVVFGLFQFQPVDVLQLVPFPFHPFDRLPLFLHDRSHSLYLHTHQQQLLLVTRFYGLTVSH